MNRGSVKIIIGTQWGDEGKGKASHYYTTHAKGDVLVARWQGGNNAGHTVHFKDSKFKLNYLPSGAVSGLDVLLGHDMVIHPLSLISEIKRVVKKTSWVPDEQLYISDRAHVTLDQQILEDGLIRAMQGKFSAKSTLKGVAPTYGDKMYRFGIRFADLKDKSMLKEKLAVLFKHKTPFFKEYSEALGSVGDALTEMYGKLGQYIFENGMNQDPALVATQLYDYGTQLYDSICDTTFHIHKLYDEGRTIICEGAQGIMLDVTHGAYPYGTSSNITPGAACVGLGITHQMIDEVIGVVKVFASRVGGGPLPTELCKDPDLSMSKEQQKSLAMRVGETGTTTGRPRRLLWVDGVALKHATRICGFDKIALTKLDVLPELRDYTDVVKIGLAYVDPAGIRYFGVPTNWAGISDWTAVYKTFPLWTTKSESEWLDIAQSGKIPTEIKPYIKFIAQIMNVKDTLLSVGPKTEATLEYHIEE